LEKSLVDVIYRKSDVRFLYNRYLKKNKHQYYSKKKKNLQGFPAMPGGSSGVGVWEFGLGF
jgi:hypothetical protein